jgi:hypothetical protein
VWRRSSVTNTTDPVVRDIDATLVEVHSENKAGTAPTYKRGFGFHRASSSSGAMTRKEFVMT